MRALLLVMAFVLGVLASAQVDAEAAAAQLQRGEYLVRLGDCVACHSVRGGQAFAGGVEIRTGFGRIFTPNITPDLDTGIGRWSADDFWNALHEGKSPDGPLYYPAFPYTNYSLVSRDDSDAMFAWLRSVPAQRKENREHALEFPYGWRGLLSVWQTLYFRPLQFRDNPAQTAEWNRGAYLVNGLGHCTACHGQRNSWGAVTVASLYSGSIVPGTDWYAPDLRDRSASSLHDVDIDASLRLLKTGQSGQRGVLGPMAEVVYHSLQYATDGDLRSMLVFLRSLPPTEATAAPPLPRGAGVSDLAARGRSLYDDHCASCHGDTGKGIENAFPALAGNPSVTSSVSANPVRMILSGGFAVSTAGNPRPYSMPPFADRLSDADVAAVATYIRSAFGNKAAAVQPADVAAQRGTY